MRLFSRDRTRLHCSFCGKPDENVAKLIAGPRVFICDGCVGLCNDILAGRPTPGFATWDGLDEKQLLAALPVSEAAIEGARKTLDDQIAALRKRDTSWAEIGQALGISRQAAWERFS